MWVFLVEAAGVTSNIHTLADLLGSMILTVSKVSVFPKIERAAGRHLFTRTSGGSFTSKSNRMFRTVLRSSLFGGQLWAEGHKPQHLLG